MKEIDVSSSHKHSRRGLLFLGVFGSATTLVSTEELAASAKSENIDDVEQRRVIDGGRP